MSSRASRTVYVGNLPGDIREKEVEDLFYKVIHRNFCIRAMFWRICGYFYLYGLSL